jgi:hypothetical protein
LRSQGVSDRPSPEPQWADEDDLHGHFRKHAPKLGISNVADYDASARETIRLGVPFAYTYEDPNIPGISEPRLGYYDRLTNRFTAVTEDEIQLLSHFRPDRGEQYVRDLPDSTYPY